MRIPSFSPIRLSGTPAWVGTILSAINPVMTSITQALHGRLSLEDNINSEIRTVTFEISSPVLSRPERVKVRIILNKIKSRPKCVIPGYSDKLLYACQITRYYSDTDVEVTMIPEFEPGSSSIATLTKVTATLIFLA